MPDNIIETASDWAEKQTIAECTIRGIEVWQVMENGDIRFTDEAQDVFDNFYSI